MTTRSLRLERHHSAAAAAPQPVPLAVDSDIVVVLASLLCALICIVGLALVARCALLRRAAAAAAAEPAPPPGKGLRRKALRSLPKVPFGAAEAGGRVAAECPICLVEFEEGDEVRVLPECGHGFHVGCVDTWLGAHPSCPSCRRVLVVPADAPPPRCRKCGARSEEPPAPPAPVVVVVAEASAVEAAGGGASRFLP